jgi:hypothetical protein
MVGKTQIIGEKQIEIKGVPITIALVKKEVEYNDGDIRTYYAVRSRIKYAPTTYMLKRNFVESFMKGVKQ